MTARILLVRHATHDLLGRVLCGRTVDVALNAAGEDQAAALGRALAGSGVTAVATSPRRRARHTACPIAAACLLPVEMAPALDEIDFGAWEGAPFADLENAPGWREWNQARSQHRPPGGEAMLAVQARIAAWIAAATVGAMIVAVSHADVIKAAVCHALGLGLDQLGRFDVDPACVTTLVAGAWGVRLERLNAAA